MPGQDEWLSPARVQKPAYSSHLPKQKSPHRRSRRRGDWFGREKEKLPRAALGFNFLLGRGSQPGHRGSVGAAGNEPHLDAPELRALIGCALA